jgi:hypothetical protein
MSRKVKDPVAAVEKMIEKKNKKMAGFSDQYMEMTEDAELDFNEDLRYLTETGDLYGNLGRIR